MSGVARYCQAVQTTSLLLLLLFGPLTGGATKPWSFSISLWLIILGTAAMVAKRVWLEKSILPRHRFEIPMLILLGLAVLSLFTSIQPPATFWAFLRLVGYLAVFYLALDATAHRANTKLLIGVVVGVGVLLSFIGLVKYFGTPMPEFWSYIPLGQEGFFLSTYLNHNHIAGYLAMCLALALAMMLSSSDFRGLAWLACVILFMICVVLTMSRGGWISIGISVAFTVTAFALKKKAGGFKVAVIGVVLAVVAGLALLGSTAAVDRFKTLEDPGDSSRVNRLVIWKASLDLVEQNPLLGTGLGTFPFAFPAVRPPGAQLRYNEAHNDYLHIVTELGLPALVPIIWALFLFFRIGLAQIRKANTGLGLAVSLGSFSGALAIIIHSISDFNIQLTANGVLFSALMGLLAGADRFRAIVKKKGDGSQTPDRKITSLDFVDAQGNVLAPDRTGGSGKTFRRSGRRS